MDESDSPALDGLLRSAAPVPLDGAARDRVLDDAWSRVQATIGNDDSRSGSSFQRRRRRTTRIATVTLAAALAGAGTAAAADFISTRTGEELTGWEQEAGGTGEVLHMGGTDRLEVFDELTADIPFAPGYEAQRTWALEFFPSETESRMTEGYLRSWMAGLAVCTWADAWVAADDAGDVVARNAATSTLAEAPEWADIRDHDRPDSIITETGEALSYRWWVRPLAEAASGGDRAALLDTVAHSATCSYQVLPVIDVASDYPHAGVR